MLDILIGKSTAHWPGESCACVCGRVSAKSKPRVGHPFHGRSARVWLELYARTAVIFSNQGPRVRLLRSSFEVVCWNSCQRREAIDQRV